MHRGNARFFRLGIIGAALAALLLAGCTSSALVGNSAFGNNELRAAEVAAVESNTPDGARVEARKHFRNGNFGYSAAYYKRLVELSPQDPEGYVGLGASYDRLRRFDLSDRVYASLFRLSGGTAQYYNNLGYSQMLRGNLSVALTNFRQAQRLAPDSVVVGNNLQLLATAARA